MLEANLTSLWRIFAGIGRALPSAENNGITVPGHNGLGSNSRARSQFVSSSVHAGPPRDRTRFTSFVVSFHTINTEGYGNVVPFQVPAEERLRRIRLFLAVSSTSAFRDLIEEVYAGFDRHLG